MYGYYNDLLGAYTTLQVFSGWFLFRNKFCNSNYSAKTTKIFQFFLEKIWYFFRLL